MGDLERRVRDASANIAFRFATDPGHAENMRAIWGGASYRSDDVAEEFGEAAAQAWIDAANARARFFAAVNAAPADLREEKDDG